MIQNTGPESRYTQAIKKKRAIFILEVGVGGWI